MAFRWRADDGPLIVHKPKKNKVVKAANINAPERVEGRLICIPQCYLCLHLEESETRYQNKIKLDICETLCFLPPTPSPTLHPRKIKSCPYKAVYTCSDTVFFRKNSREFFLRNFTNGKFLENKTLVKLLCRLLMGRLT